MLLRGSGVAKQCKRNLSSEEMGEVMAKHNAIMKELGIVNLITCDTYWCNEAYPYFGIDVMPSVEANVKMMQALEAFDWKQAVDSVTMLGIPLPE
jgi:hypothetical protein